MNDSEQQSAFDAQRFIQQLTTRPGVYRMYDADGELLYVGKARNIKKRVSSYFRCSAIGAKTEAMLAHLATIEVTITATEDEALILESTLIKRYKPRYNILLRDDKSYPYLLITSNHAFPRLVCHRGLHTIPGHYFGPFPSMTAVRQTRDTLRRLFKLRICSDREFTRRTRPCLDYYLGLCSAPCMGYISKEDYARDVADAIALLKGRNEQVSGRLGMEMKAASDACDFEQAAYLRDKIAALRRLQAQARTAGGRGDFDIICAASAGGLAAVVVDTIRGGNDLGHRSFYPRIPADSRPQEIMTAFLGQYYLERKPPPEILLDPALDDPEWLAESLSQLAGRRIVLKFRVRGKRAQWLANVRATLTQAMSLYLTGCTGNQQRLLALMKTLDLSGPPMRIVCFDINHMQGETTVASCVVFEAGIPQESAYRRFNIHDIEPGDDYAAIKQALTRRFKRVKAGEILPPDLLLIDGGRGQLGVAEQTLATLGIEDVALAVVAKGANRKPGSEQLFLPGRASPLILPPDSTALHLVQQIRDEAHRFAITAHRHQRRKVSKNSVLDSIDGLGPKRRSQLLQAFGGPRQIARSNVPELARVDGISTTLAQRIYDHFHERIG